jgi:hypothetical protein
MNVTLKVALTNDTDMGELSTVGQFKMIPLVDVENYLNVNPRHAAVLDRTDHHVAVFRGASDEPTNFYVARLPVEDPGEADFGDLTAGDALQEALNY